ncbi:MAG: magnesium/cobalt transporter CorA [Actinomycetota bacterium]
MIVDHVVYRNGERVGAGEAGADGVVWLSLADPTPDELEKLGRDFDLHPLALEDAVHAHQRPKLDQYGETLYLVLRPARYLDETETVDFSELHVFVGPRFVITIAHGAVPDLKHVREQLEARPDLLRLGPMPIVHGIVDDVVDGYSPVVEGVENDIDEIESEVFGGGTDASRRTYQLLREVIQFRRAVQPLATILEQLMKQPDFDEEEQRYLRDVHDHVIRIHEKVDAFGELLRSILSVNLTIETKALSEAANRQNEEVKKISAWAAILFAPTIVGTVYGMNFDHMPELHWRFGYAMALGMMFTVSVGLYLLFKRRGWI